MDFMDTPAQNLKVHNKISGSFNAYASLNVTNARYPFDDNLIYCY